jgi:alpha-L-fucosidase
MKKLLFISMVIMAAGCAATTTPPVAYGPVPTAEQLEWQKMEYYMFAHFGPNTFTDMEWGHGDENPAVFAPTALDCRQWAATAKAAGMKGIILTAKHHDGFCLWPSEFSTHTVREAGQPDVVRALSEACAAEGIKFGVYVSPWDRNHPAYGTPEYNEVFASTLREVLTGYGDVFEQWLDGANGEGPNGKRQVYDWPLIHGAIRESQPHAVIFSDVGPDCRWIGNERGIGGVTNWSRLNIAGFTPGHGAPKTDTLNRGNIHGVQWVPAEADISIRPGWFYSASTDDRVKTVDSLDRIWLTSVGRNANLLLNVPPDRTGRINPIDSARLMEFRALRDATYSSDLAEGARVKADVRRGRKFEAQNIVSPDYDAYWAAPDGVTAAVLEITLPEERTFNRLQLQEYIPLGQRVEKWHAEYWDGAAWAPFAEGTTIGYKRIVAGPDVTTSRLRIHIDASLACPVINGLALFKAPK